MWTRLLKIKFETFDGQTEELNHRPPRHILRCPLREKIHFSALNKDKEDKICLSPDRFVHGMQRDPSKKGPSNFIRSHPIILQVHVPLTIKNFRFREPLGVLSINFKFQIQRAIGVLSIHLKFQIQRAIGVLSIHFKFQIQRTIGGPFNQFKSLDSENN